MATPSSMVTQLVNLAKMTEVRNEIIKSPNIAMIEVMKHAGKNLSTAPNKAGVLSFTLAEESRKSKDLLNCKLGSSAIKDDTILLVRIWAAAARYACIYASFQCPHILIIK